MPTTNTTTHAAGFNAHDRTEGRDEWLTPPHILDALGPFDLDPCSPGENRSPWRTARRMIGLPQDGLAIEWTGRVWLNPPYGAETPRWLDRLSRHGDGIALVFARTDTAWWHNVACTADAGLFLAGRLKFCDVSGRPGAHSAGAPSVLLAWGEHNVTALRDSRLRGHLVQFA